MHRNTKGCENHNHIKCGDEKTTYMCKHCPMSKNESGLVVVRVVVLVVVRVVAVVVGVGVVVAFRVWVKIVAT